ncbi:MAG: succinylglutamate desuccinylase/aspartoacylase family protein [Planctomycetes bacterium]|nr:succinylglutamate desuccinylase/aspartoacylase family protein [Planctomycetota bacterium]
MITTQIDLSRQGKQQGYLQVPYSHNLGGWANVMIPMTVIARGSGPTVLALGGNHGDEYQGQVAIMKLAQRISEGDVQGRLILIPSLNFPAALAATRLSPIDGMNLNRAFPGDAHGSVTSQIAHYLTHELFPISDAVIDIHSGGRSMEFVPCSHMHVVSDRAQRQSMLDAMLAWNTDFCFLYTDIAGSGLLPVEAENQGKTVITTELGGGEAIPASVHRIAHDGLVNVLRHLGVLSGALQSRESLGLPPTVLTQALESKNYLLAPESGIFEVCVELGDMVAVDQPIGRIHFLERPDRQPIEILAPKPGYLICMRSPCKTQQGDCVAVIGEQVCVESVMAR